MKRTIYILFILVSFLLSSCSSINIPSSRFNSLIGTKLDLDFQITKMGIDFNIKTLHKNTEILNNKIYSDLGLEVNSKVFNYSGDIKISYNLYVKDNKIYIKDIKLEKMANQDGSNYGTFTPIIINAVFSIIKEIELYNLEESKIPFVNKIKGINIVDNNLKIEF